MELPAALVPWRESLELLDPTVALALGPMLQRLDLAIGPHRAQSRSGDGDPDGFNGIARRGTYERLLISEWLLAEEMPEEFTRRALTGEHAFLQLARLAPAGEQRCVALFDAGADQWGAPRIAHLAALIVLERRARAARIPFRWGILQDEEQCLRPAGNQAALRQLLELRSRLPLAPQHVSGWLQQLLSGSSARQELWIIGGSRALSYAGTSVSGLRIEEPLEPDADGLEACVVRPAATPKNLLLPLPDGATRVRLLRDPFRSVVAAPQQVTHKLAPASNLVFSSSGNKLFARAHDGALIAYPIPNSPLAGVGKPRLLQTNRSGTIVAAGRTRKVTVVLVADFENEFLSLECVSGFHVRLPNGPVPVPATLDWNAGPNPRLGELFGVWPGNEPELFAHSHGALLRIKKNVAAPPSTEVIAESLGAVSATTLGLAYTTRRDGEWLKAVYPPNTNAPDIVRPGAGSRACGGFGGSVASQYWGLSGLQCDDGTWRVEAGETVWQISPPAGTEVFGVAAPMKYGESPGIVVLEGDRRTISVLGLNWSHRLPEASAEIRFTSVSTVAGQIAYATVQGEVVIYSLPYTTILYRLTAAGEGR